MPAIRTRGFAVLVVVLAALLAPASSATAAPLIGSSFDSNDGDQVTAGLVKDWQDARASPHLTTNLDTQATDDCFIGGNKEDTPNAWNFNVSAGGCIPGKSDLLGMWSNSELTPSASILHAAFVRQAPNGNTFITFELNRSAASWVNSVGATIPCRSTGDLLLAYDIGGSTIAVTIYRWTGDGTGPAGCPDGANGTFTSSSAANNGMINATLITNHLSTATIGSSVDPNLFGEAQIDVASVLGSMGITGCFSYIQAQAHTRSSSSISSALIDNVKPVATKVANCSVTGTVFGDVNANAARDAGEAGLSGRTVYVDVNNNGSFDAGEPTTTTDADGFYEVVTNFTSGTYPVRLAVPAGNICTTPAGCAFNATFTSAGVNSVNNAYGLYVSATVSGTAYVDANGNGTRNAGENTPIADRTVFGDTNNNGSLDAGEPTATTDTGGNYTVGGLLPGTARIRFVNGGGWVCDAPTNCLHTVAVSGGQVVTGRDFLAFQAPSVGGTIYADADADAVRDGGENGVGEFSVRLYAADGTTLLATTSTGLGGDYSFSAADFPAFAPGSYVVTVVPPAGTRCSAACATPLTLASGQNATSDAGVFQNATVSGTAYTDSNNNAARDGGEPSAPGVQIYADLDNGGAFDAGEPTTTTDGAGNYTLAGLRPGAVHIRAALAPSFACSTPTGCDHPVTLVSGAALTGRDYGLVQAATAIGRVAVDNNASATIDAGEPPLDDWRVYVDLDGDGAFDAGEPFALTAGDGTYAIANITPGTRTLRVDAPAGWTCSSPCSRSVPFASGATTPNLNFTLYQPAGIGGVVYEDEDGDGARDGGEAGLADRTVFLDANGDGDVDPGEPIATTVAGGAYAFTGLAPGTYSVRAAGEPGWTCSDCAATRTLTSGQQVSEDFGRWLAGTAAGAVYVDADGDGTRDPGEPGIPDRAVFFDLDDNGTAGPGEPATTTDANGAYSLGPIGPGAGTLRAVLPAGFVPTQPVTDGYALTITSSDAPAGRDFGGYVPGSITGHVANDLNGNGVDDPGEPGKAGWTMYLDTDDDGVQDSGEPTAVTNASGDYTFGSLAPATYRVRPAITAGFACTKPALCVYVNALVSGENATARDFALVEAASVAGVVYADADGDGGRDSGEAGRGGRTVFVDYDGDGTQDPGEPGATTDDSGAYKIAGVSPGTFKVRYAAPAAETVTDPASGLRTLTFASGDAFAEQDFGSYVAATISGAVYDDADASGDRQGGEGGLPGRTVDLDAGADGSVEQTATTDESGGYTFAALAPGLYRVTVTVPRGSNCTAPSPCRHDRTLTSGASSASNDFAVYRIPVADLSLTKSAPATVDEGATFDYTLAVSNAGPDAAEFVVIQDALPSGVKFVSVSAGCDYSAPYVTCALGTIADGGSATVTISVRAVDAGAIANSASVSSQTGDPTPANNDDGADVTATPVADVGIDKSGPGSVAAGGSATYTLTATNNGPSAATGVVIRDTLPPGMTFDAGASDAGWALVSPGVYEFAVGALANGASASAQLVATANHGAADSTQTNSGAVTSTSLDTTPANDDDTRATDVGPSANLAMTKTVDDATIAQGRTAVFTLVAHNGGPSAASNVVVADPLPAGVTFVSLASPAGWSCATPDVGSGGTVSCSAPSLADGVDATFTVTVTGVATGTHSNTAGVDSDTPDASGANDEATATLDVDPTADVALTKDGPEGVDAGADATYTLTATNNGPSTAHGVVVTDTLPAGMTFVSLSAPAGASCTTPAVGAGGTVRCASATLANGASLVFTLVARAGFALAETAVENTATVDADELDPSPGNDDDTASTQVGPASDLRLRKTVSVPALPQGQSLTYTLTATNDGPSDATKVTVTDPLPAGVSFVSASAGCSNSSGTVTCDLGAIANGANASATITVTATANGMHVNTATVSSDHPDPDPSDNPASASVDVGPTADVSIVKSAPATVAAGGRLTYTLNVHNSGPSTANSVSVHDTLPAGMTHVSSSASPGACDLSSDTVTCVLGSLADGASASVTITVQATFALAGTSVQNTATVSSATNDDDPGDNASTRAVAVGPAADLVFAKDAPAHVPAGGQLLYSLRVTNNGPQAAANVVVTDTLPPGLSFVSGVPTQGSCSAAGQLVTCAIGTLANGAGAQVALTASVAAGLGGQSIHNTAVAASDTTETDPASNTDDATTAADALASQHADPPAPELGSLSVRKTADAGTKVMLGHSVAFTIRVANDADRTAHNVVAIDQPSQSATVNSVRPDKGTCDGLTCRLGDLAPHEVVLIGVVMTPRKTGAFENAVVVQSDDGERAAADNRGVAGVQVKAGRTTLRLRKTVNHATVRAGQSVWFTITATNTGRETAANVRVCDIPAPNTTFLVARSAKLTKGRACWAIESLAPGSHVTYRVKARVAGNARRNVKTTATVTASNADPRNARRSVRVIAGPVSVVAGVTG